MGMKISYHIALLLEGDQVSQNTQLDKGSGVKENMMRDDYVIIYDI